MIPVSGIGSKKEAEVRATSAVLAVMSMVRDLSVALFSPLGASRAAKATVETFTEPQFVLEGKKCRPDGLVRVSYGKSRWTALVEVKTGDSTLDAEQVNTYWDLAREHGYDAVITISNELAPVAGVHPTDGLRVRSNSKVKVHHLSWTALLTAAVMVKVHHGVADPEQSWLMGELIRYLEHPASGAMSFDDMGPHWTSVRDAARDGALRKSDEGVHDIAVRWDQLIRFAALQLGSRIGDDVQHLLPRNQQDPRSRSAHLVDALCDGLPLDGTLRVPNTVSDIDVTADLKARRLTAAISVPAPEDRGARGRCGWMLSQLQDAPAGLVIEAFPKNARTAPTATLAEAREDRGLLLDDDKRDPFRFRISLAAEMGAGRKTGTRAPGFIDSVVSLIENFYGEVVQTITPWTPRAPKIKKTATDAVSDEEGGPAESSMRPTPPFRFPTAF